MVSFFLFGEIVLKCPNACSGIHEGGYFSYPVNSLGCEISILPYNFGLPCGGILKLSSFGSKQREKICMS